MSNGLGDIIKAYSDYIGTLGYNENSMIDREDYEPESTTHKSYYVQCVGKTGEQHSGNHETVALGLLVNVLMEYPVGPGYAAAEKDNWNDLDELERELLNFASGRLDHLIHENTEVSRVGEYKLFSMLFSCNFERDLSVN